MSDDEFLQYLEEILDGDGARAEQWKQPPGDTPVIVRHAGIVRGLGVTYGTLSPPLLEVREGGEEGEEGGEDVGEGLEESFWPRRTTVVCSGARQWSSQIGGLCCSPGD